MARLITLVLVSVAIFAGCDRQSPRAQFKNPPPQTNVIPVPPTNAAATGSGKEVHAPISDLFKSQLVKLVEETTKLDQMVAQGVAPAEIKAQLPAAKASLELARLTWPDGFATNALSSFRDAIRAWEFAIDLRERIPKLNSEQKEILNNRNYNAEEAQTFLQGAETTYTPNEAENNGYQEIASFGQEALVYSIYPNDYKMRGYRGKKFLPLHENIIALQKLASTRLKNAREEALKNLR